MSFRGRLALTACTILTAFVCCLAPARGEGTLLLQPQYAPALFRQPSGWPAVLGASKSLERIGPGVFYERWQVLTASGPLGICVATIDLRNPYVELAVASHQALVQGNGERLSTMADGLRAELGINADYFDINESGAPLNVLLENGRLLHQPDGAVAFIALADNRVVMQPVTWQASVTTASGNAYRLSTLNEWSSASTLSLLTPALGGNPAGAGLEVVFTPRQAALNDSPPAPSPSASQNEAGAFIVSARGTNVASLYPLTGDQIALAARGAQAQRLAPDFALGDPIAIRMDADPPLDTMQLAVGGGPLLLRNDQYAVDPAAPAPEETNVRNPVTAAGINASGSTLWLVVVDGRAPGVSIGLTRPMLASLLQSMGATTAMAFDSGGSSEMVVRHRGDMQVSIANTPSDGRERGIADGLFIVNSAPVGEARALLVHAPAQSVLTGSHLQLYVNAVDANDQPVGLVSGVQYAVTPSAVADINASGLLTAHHPGQANLQVRADSTGAKLRLRVVGQAKALSIQGFNRVVPLEGRASLTALALDETGTPVSVDPQAIAWQAAGSGGSINAAGVFHATNHAGVTTVTARAGGRQSSLVVLTGDHLLRIQNRLIAGSKPQQWHFRGQPESMAGELSETSAPDGSVALRLRYDFSSSQKTRAAYAESALSLCGRPLGIAVEVYGDANGEWLRGGYRNADGNNESLTLARHVDWRGWRTIRTSIPRQAAWPIVWTRFYVVERSSEAHEQGELWLQNVSVVYAGPESLGCSG